MENKNDFLNLDDRTKLTDGLYKFIEPEKVRLVNLLMEKSFSVGEFTLSSGKKSNFYVDVRQMILYSEGALLIAKLTNLFTCLLFLSAFLSLDLCLTSFKSFNGFNFIF